MATWDMLSAGRSGPVNGSGPPLPVAGGRPTEATRWTPRCTVDRGRDGDTDDVIRGKRGGRPGGPWTTVGSLPRITCAGRPVSTGVRGTSPPGTRPPCDASRPSPLIVDVPEGMHMPTLSGWVVTWGLILGTALAIWWFVRRANYQNK